MILEYNKGEMRLKLIHKFVIAITLVSVVPLIFVGLNILSINRVSLQTRTLEYHEHMATSIAERYISYIDGILQRVRYLHEMLESQPVIESLMHSFELKHELLTKFIESNRDVVFLSVLDKGGKEILKIIQPGFDENEKLMDYSKDDAFKLAIKRSQPVVSDVYFYNLNPDNPRVNVFHPGRIHLLISINLKHLWDDVIRFIRGRETRTVYLVDKTGRVICHHDKSKIFADLSSLPIISQAIQARVGGSSEYRDETGEMVVGSYSPVTLLGEKFLAAVIVTQPKKDAYYSVMLIQRQALYMLILSLIAAVIVSVLLAGGLSKPILLIARSAQKVAAQDFDTRVDIKSRDELGMLANTFNSMVSQLKKYADIQLDKLIAEKTKTEAVVLSIDDGIVMTNREGHILLINNKAKKILDVTDISPEKTIFDYIKSNELKKAFESLFPHDTDIAREEADISGKDYTRVYQVISQPVRTSKGEYLGKVFVMRDISLERELDKMKDDFLHSITHDLRNPMTSIRGFVKFLLDGVAGPLNEQQRKMLDTVDRASFRLLGLINDILDVAKMEAGKMTLELSSVNLKDICNEVLNIYQPQAERKSISLEMVTDGEIPKIYADGKLLERVYTNLIGNALKFTPENGKITVKIQDNTDYVQSSVIDTGEGIPPEYLEKIFDKYQQVAGHRKGGTGLGLTICKYIIEAHGGKIWVESKLKEGSKFTFILPKKGPIKV